MAFFLFVKQVVEKLGEVTTLTNVYNGLKEKMSKIQALRIPMNQEVAPEESCFDKIVGLLKVNYFCFVTVKRGKCAIAGEFRKTLKTQVSMNIH